MIWLYDNIDMRIEGRIIVRVFLPLEHMALNCVFTGRLSYDRHLRLCIDMLFLRVNRTHPLLAREHSPTTLTDFRLHQGFDEFMNVVIDEAAEVYVKDANPRRELGVLLRYTIPPSN